MHRRKKSLLTSLLLFSFVFFATNSASTLSVLNTTHTLRSIEQANAAIDAIAVWQHGEIGAHDIWYSIWDDTNSEWWASSGVQASPMAELPGNDLDPSIAFDRQGNAIAVWSHGTGNASLGYDIWWSRWSGNDWASPTEVAPLSGDDTDPAVAFDTNGWAITIWVHNGTYIYSSLCDGTSWIGSAQAIVPDWPQLPFLKGSSLPEIAFTSKKANGYTSNKAVAIWTQSIAYPEVPPLLTSRIYSAIWDGTGWSPSPAEEISGQVYDAAKDGKPALFRNGISSDNLNNAFAVWATDNITRPIYYASWDGHIWSDAESLDIHEAYGYMPAVAFSAANDIILTFTHNTTNLWHSRCVSGGWQPATYAADSGGHDSRSSIAFLMSNRALAVWSSDAEAFMPSEVFYSRWNPATEMWTTAASILPQGLSGQDANPCIASKSGSPTMPPIALSSEIHDLAVIDASPLKTVAGQGYAVSINVTVENQGTAVETFNITIYANANYAGKLEDLALPSGSSAVFTLTWDTLGFAYGNYSTSASVNLPPYIVDVDPADNSKPANSDVMITIPGDVNGDKMADVYDSILLAKAYSTQPESPRWNPETDINNDDKTDASDLIILSTNYGYSW